MSPGGRNRGSCTSKTGTGAVTAAASASSVASGADCPVRSQPRIVSLSSHSPITLVRKRTRPSTPPSLVKLASRAASVSTGAGSSTPTRPHVPQEMYAAWSLAIGTPTTADAVSWEPTVVTVRPGAPRWRPRLDSTGPTTVPGSTRSPNSPAGRPSRSISSRSHSPVRTSSSPVVEALVRSVTATPVSQ